MSLASLQKRAEALEKELAHASFSDLEAFRQRFVSKKGALAELFAELRGLPHAEKQSISPLLNQLKTEALAMLKRNTPQGPPKGATAPRAEDLTLPVAGVPPGARHPIQHVLQQAVLHFQHLGFEVAEGPEIETDWYNFTALHFPDHHPARDMQDTFFLARCPDILLRTHTSSVQIRMMEKYRPPLRMIMPGRVYRNETITARSHCFFHQIEGLYLDRQVNVLDMRNTLTYFLQQLFGEQLKLRFRASYFPFTEPSMEVDIGCLQCEGGGCTLCKQSGWLEIAGCGMVDPQVLLNCKIDPEKYGGFAFGIGIERLTLLRYGIEDIRLLSQCDVRMLQQFPVDGFMR